MTLQQQIEKKNKVFLSITVDPRIKEEIDEVRGILSKSQYVQQALSERIQKDRIRSSRQKR